MKNYDKSEILAKFEHAINLAEDPRMDDKMFGVLYAVLSLSLDNRITELERGRSKSARVQKELAHLVPVKKCFQSKINVAKKAEMLKELVQAYKLFSDIH